MKKVLTDKDLKKINDFSKKWKAAFEDTKTTEKAFGFRFNLECTILGFDMDCGAAFSAAYGKACHSSEELEAVIGEITDIKLLCSGIYSNFRFITSWSDEYITNDNNRRWFTLALNRLDELTSSAE